MKKCSYCAEAIQDEATKCRFCGEWLNKKRIMNEVTGAVKKDIKNAEYSDTNFILNATLPTAGKSVTGWIFIVCGAIVGGLVYFLPLSTLVGSEGRPHTVLYFIGFMFVSAGAWLGKILHEKIKNKLD